jgi:hypothetical protein
MTPHASIKLILLIFALLLTNLLKAQSDEKWDLYMARYEKGPGTMLVNMGIKNSAPVSHLPFIVITGVTFKGCDGAGFPGKDQFPKLYEVSDSVKKIISNAGQSVMVGTFTYQCQRLDYYYTNDTTNIRSTLNNLYNRSFAQLTPYTKIDVDKNWEAYLTFIYPNEETQEYMRNTKVVMQLQKSGDQLTEARKVDHWLYFKKQADLNCMTAYVKGKNFVVEKTNKSKKADFPFSLQISREDKVDIGSITAVTLELSRQAHNCKGEYDGWETFVIK